MKYLSHHFKNKRGILVTLCTLINIILTLAISFLLSALVYSKDDPTHYIPMLSIITVAVVAAISGVICAMLDRDAPVLTSLLCSLLFVAITLGLGLILSGGRLGIYAPISYALFISISVLFSFLLRKRRRR